MTENSEFSNDRVELTEGLKKRNKALGLALAALVVLIGVVSYVKIKEATGNRIQAEKSEQQNDNAGRK